MAELEHIRRDIQDGDLQLAVSHILDKINKYSSRYRNEVLLQAASLRQLHIDSRKGLLSSSEERIAKNHITDALLELIDDIENELRQNEKLINDADLREYIKKPSNMDEGISIAKHPRDKSARNTPNVGNLMDDDQRRHLEVLRQIHLKQLRALEEQAAKFGLHVPSYITAEIEDRQREVADTERKLNPEPATEPSSPISTAVPAPTTPTSAVILEVFFSYAHEDEALRDKLAKHLRNLERQKVITGWHDRQISAGTEWAGKIDVHLDSARIILLLVSPDFIDSDYCYDVELQHAMARHHAREARVIPIILRPVDWAGTPFAKLQALPKDGKPIALWPNEDEAFLDVARAIRRVAEELH